MGIEAINNALNEIEQGKRNDIVAVSENIVELWKQNSTDAIMLNSLSNRALILLGQKRKGE